MQRKLKKKFSIFLALILAIGTLFSGTMSVQAEEVQREILSLSFDINEVKEPIYEDEVPDSFYVQPNDGNSRTDGSEIFVNWMVK